MIITYSDGEFFFDREEEADYEVIDCVIDPTNFELQTLELATYCDGYRLEWKGDVNGGNTVKVYDDAGTLHSLSSDELNEAVKILVEELGDIVIANSKNG